MCITDYSNQRNDSRESSDAYDVDYTTVLQTMSTYPSSTKLFVVLPPATANDSAIFGVNSVRPIHEVLDVVYLPASKSVAKTTVKVSFVFLQ